MKKFKILVASLVLLMPMCCFASEGRIEWVEFRRADGSVGECMAQDLGAALNIQMAKKRGMGRSIKQSSYKPQSHIQGSIALQEMHFVKPDNDSDEEVVKHCGPAQTVYNNVISNLNMTSKEMTQFVRDVIDHDTTLRQASKHNIAAESCSGSKYVNSVPRFVREDAWTNDSRLTKMSEADALCIKELLDDDDKKKQAISLQSIDSGNNSSIYQQGMPGLEDMSDSDELDLR